MTMKRIYMFVLMMCLLVTQLSAQQKYSSAVVGFYNLENLYDTILHPTNDDAAFTPNGSKSYTWDVFTDKINKLATVISQIGTDVNPDGPAILGVSEIENLSVLETLVNHPLLKERGYKIVHYDSKDFRGVDVAMLYNPKYFKVESSKPLFVQMPDGSKTSVFTRDILWVTGSLQGERVDVFVNHWPSRSGGEKRSMPARMAAAATARKTIDNIFKNNKDAKVIVMGDLNDDPINESLTKGLKSVDAVQSIKPDELYNPWMSLYKKGIGTLAYQDAWSLFDQILISPGFIDKKQDGFFYYKNQIFRQEYMVENIGRYKGYPMRTYSGDVYRGGYSDHFPVYIVLLKRVME